MRQTRSRSEVSLENCTVDSADRCISSTTIGSNTRGSDRASNAIVSFAILSIGNGFEAIAKVGLGGLNSYTSNQAALNDLEARYHYRLTQGIPLSFLREFQVSLFVGFERYRNSGGAIYLSQYDLMKIGATLEFPLFSNWSGGGEWIYGQASDQSHSTVLTGNLHYHFSRRYSIGTGYRFTYFESNSSPQGISSALPFRESMVEGFTSVDYGF